MRPENGRRHLAEPTLRVGVSGNAPLVGGDFDDQPDEPVWEKSVMFADEGTSTYKELRRLAEALAAPIDFDRLVAAGVWRERGRGTRCWTWPGCPNPRG